MNITKITDLSLHKLNGELNGEKYWIEVEGDYLTPLLRNALAKNVTDPLLLATELSERIKNWNLWKEKEGDLLPDFETISHLDDEIVFSLVNTFSQVWGGDKKKPQNAQNGSAQAASSANP